MPIIFRDIFPSLAATDGRYEDESQNKRDKRIKDIYKNTKKWLSFKVNGKPNLIPIAPHEKTSEESMGNLVDIKLAKKDYPKKHYTIIGKIELFEDVFKKYQQGRFPGVSVVTDPAGANISQFTGNESDKIGEYICECALLGQSPAAYPNLEIYDNHSYQAQYNSFSAMKKAPIREPKNKHEKEEFMITPEKLQELIEGIANLLKSALMGEEEELTTDEKDLKEPKPGFELNDEELEEAATEPEYDKEIDPKDIEREAETVPKEAYDALMQRVEALERKNKDEDEDKVETEFQAFVKQQQATQDDQEEFKVLAHAKGISFARKQFARRPKIIPENDVIQNPDDDEQVKKSTEYKLYFNHWLGRGMSDEDADKNAKAMVRETHLKKTA